MRVKKKLFQKLPPLPTPPPNPIAIEEQVKLTQESKGGKFNKSGTYNEGYVEILLSAINGIKCQTWSSMWFSGLKGKFQVYSHRDVHL